MMRSVLLLCGLCGVLAGCSWTSGGTASPTAAKPSEQKGRGYFNVTVELPTPRRGHLKLWGRLVCPSAADARKGACEELATHYSDYTFKAKHEARTSSVVQRITICGGWNRTGLYDVYQPRDAPQFLAWYRLVFAPSDPFHLTIVRQPACFVSTVGG
jgi:hypothetical protein